MRPLFSLGFLAPMALLGVSSSDGTVPPVTTGPPTATSEAEPADEARDATERPVTPPAAPDDQPVHCQTLCGKMSFDAFTSTLQDCGINPETSGCTYHGNGQFSNPGDAGAGACTVTFELAALGAGTRADVSENKGKGSSWQWQDADSALVLTVKDGMIVKSVRLRRAAGDCLGP